MDDKSKDSIQAPEETKPEVVITPWAHKETTNFTKKDKAKAEALVPAPIFNLLTNWKMLKACFLTTLSTMKSFKFKNK